MGEYNRKPHPHSLDHSVKHIRYAFFLNLFFSIVEVVGGILTNSVAILSDALHDLGDSVALGISWYFQNVSKRQSNKKYSYGYGRYSVVGALVSTFILAVGSILIISESIPRLIHPEEADALGMIWIAVLGVLVNGASVWRLRKGKSLNEKVVALHLLEDALGWIAVLIGAVVMYFYDVPILDPILSLMIASWILFNVYRNLRKIFHILLQATPKGIDIEEITAHIQGIPGVLGVHDCHVWSMDGEYNVMTGRCSGGFGDNRCSAKKYQVQHLGNPEGAGYQSCNNRV